MTGLVLTLAVDPATVAKNLERAVVAKRGPNRGKAFVAHPHVNKGVIDSIKGQAFSAGMGTIGGPVVVGIVAHWAKAWGPKGRAPGRPRGDVDAPVMAVLDALGAGSPKRPGAGLFGDDAWVAVLVAANVVDARDPRIECFVGELTPDVLAWVGRRLRLEVPHERVLLGGQQEALLR